MPSATGRGTRGSPNGLSTPGGEGRRMVPSSLSAPGCCQLHFPLSLRSLQQEMPFTWFHCSLPVLK